MKNKLQKNIPNNWQEKKLKNVLKVGSGKDYKHLNIGNIPVFGTGGYMLSVDKFLYSGETVFIGRKGTIDKPFYFKGRFWTVDTLFYTHDYKNTSAKYISFIFQKINWKLYNEASGVPSLSKTTIENIKFVFPPLPEQKRIVAVLETWDEYLEKLEEKIKLKKNIKKGLMQKLLSGEIRLKGYNEKWKIFYLKEIGDVRTSSVDKKCVTGEKEVRLLNYMDVYRRDHISNNDEFQKVTAKNHQINSSNLKRGDILFTPSSETQDDIGHSAVVVEDLEKVVFSYHLMRFRPKNKTLNYKFSAYCFKTYNFYLELWKKSQGATRFTLSKEALEKSKIIIPLDIKEQIAISQILTNVDQEIKFLEKNKNIIKEQKKYLLNNLVTGSIRTPENLKIR